MITLDPVVDGAVALVRASFPDAGVDVIADGLGGGFVVIDSVDLGPRYNPASTWLGFHVSPAYPHADVYPHYIARVTRIDGMPHGVAFQSVEWQGREALQVSRRSNRWNPSRDDAVLKAQKVLTWIRAQ